MREMYRYIGVDDNFIPNTSEKAQVAKVPKNEAINNLLQRKNTLRDIAANVLKTVLPLEIRQKLRGSLINLNSQDKKEVPLSSEDRQKLREIYREDILKLQDLIDRDLSKWIAL
jgi:hypothetical protein